MIFTCLIPESYFKVIKSNICVISDIYPLMMYFELVVNFWCDLWWISQAIFNKQNWEFWNYVLFCLRGLLLRLWTPLMRLNIRFTSFWTNNNTKQVAISGISFSSWHKFVFMTQVCLHDTSLSSWHIFVFMTQVFFIIQTSRSTKNKLVICSKLNKVVHWIPIFSIWIQIYYF